MQRGFTLIEMLVVLVLVGVLAGLVGPALIPREHDSDPDAIAPAIAQAREAALRRSETMLLRFEPSGDWRLDGTASREDGPLATGHVSDATLLGGGEATLVVSPLGSCAFDARSSRAARSAPLDPLTCELRPDTARARPPMKARTGFTLLEAMVALVIVGLVALGYLEVFGGATRTTTRVREWTRAAEYAEAGMESVKLASRRDELPGVEQLDGGFVRRVERSAWREGSLDVVTVVVTMPDGAELRLSRLMGAR